MTPTELINKTKEEHEHQLELLSRIPESIQLGHITGRTIFLDEVVYAVNIESLHLLRKALGAYKLAHYYASGRCLAINYHFSDCEVVFFSTNAEEALASVSNGKCQITQRATTTTEASVVCMIEGAEDE